MKINRNIAWATSFVNELAAGGVKYACISPGSRNTPLTWAFANNNKIKKYVHIDERSSAFFAVGLANRTGSPVALVCTSGTASVEFYPAIVEAYLQRIPLIICTADRPAELRNTGTNQTINQDNLYKNHIRWFTDAGLPGLTSSKITHLKNMAVKAIGVSCFINKGPVHINFPFRKPFEPDIYTDKINPNIESLLIKTFNSGTLEYKEPVIENKLIQLANKLLKLKKGLIFVGPENYGKDFYLEVNKLSGLLGYPLMADGASQLRYTEQQSSPKNVLANKLICNYEGLFRSQEFMKEYIPEVVIQFGRTPNSRGIEDFYEKHSPLKIIVNAEGDIFDPSRKGKLYKSSPIVFCNVINKLLQEQHHLQTRNKWVDVYNEADTEIERLKEKILSSSDSISEPGIVNEFLNAVPDNSVIMLSNSLPVRDFDFFASRCYKNLTIYHNRGASGIDGILSTALGIAAVKRTPVFLITGDIAYYYDINALLIAQKYNISLTVILINNNGGGIFNSLPIARYRNFLNEYLLTPHNLNFKKLTEAFGVKYYFVNTLTKFRKFIINTNRENKTIVIEVKTNSNKSLLLRKKYWLECQSLLMKLVKSHL